MGKKNKKTKQLVKDALLNQLANIGTDKDKKSHSHFAQRIPLTRVELEAFYQWEWAAKCIDIKVYDMLREGWEIKCPSLDPKKIEQLKNEDRNLKLKQKLTDALTWGYLYGGSVLVIKMNDSQEAQEELASENLKNSKIKNLIPLDRYYVSYTDVNLDPLKDDFMLPDYYTVLGSTDARIHKSRLFRFEGKQVPLQVKITLNYWGDSYLTRPYHAILDYSTIASAIASLVLEAKIDIIKVKGLMNLVNSPDGLNRLINRMTMVNSTKSVNNATLLDAEEDFATKTISFSQLPELLFKYIEIMSGASDIPVTRFLGNAVSGLGSNGENNLENYYSIIAGMQEDDLQDHLLRYYKIQCMCLFGEFPEDFSIKFPPLWTESRQEKASADSAETQNLLNQQNLGVPVYMLLKEIKQRGLNDNLTDEYIEQVKKEFDELDDDLNNLTEGDLTNEE